MKYGYELIGKRIVITQAFNHIHIGMDMTYGSNMTFGVDHMFNNEKPPSGGGD